MATFPTRQTPLTQQYNLMDDPWKQQMASIAVPPGTGLVTAPQSPMALPNNPAPNANLPYPGMPTAEQAQFREINPIYRTVQDNETVRGQLGEIMATDSPLLQRARARAAATSAGRGLLNSTMGAQAGEAAMYDVAMPIASQDASTYGQAASQNQTVGNQAQEFNAGAFNTNQQFNVGQRNQFGLEGVRQSGEDRRQAVTEGGLNSRQAVSERGAMDRLNIGEAGQTLRSREQNQTAITTTGMNNATQRYGVDVGAQTQRYGIDVGASTQRYGIDVGASTQRYATDVGASVSRENAQLAASTSRYTADLSAQTQQSVSAAANAAAASRGGAELLNSMNNRLYQINANPDFTPADRNRMAQAEAERMNAGLTLLRGASSINLAVG